jgi:glutamate formiminotransferase / 5-formyltetrahydrofolate cyclo-ligase
VLECVVNVSEGDDNVVLDALRAAGGGSLLDLHADTHHNRAVITLAGPDVEEAVRAVAAEATTRIDLGRHHGVHPRLGAVDVVPFAPLEGSAIDDALRARDRFAVWAGKELAVPCFLYGPERSLPAVRRLAFSALAPDAGPPEPHPTAGAICVGARPVLIAFNVVLTDAVAAEVATAVRGPVVRALGLDVGEGVAQVSMNLLDWTTVGPAEAYDRVAQLAAEAGTKVAGTELVGLLPTAALEAVPKDRWDELGLSADRTIEQRLVGR